MTIAPLLANRFIPFTAVRPTDSARLAIGGECSGSDAP
jgi:hypothetical protein